MIETTKFFYNKNLHTEIATELNQLASSKQAQVSRWVNNSKGRQVVTYIVHTGERNEFASKQENVLFKTSEDAGRGRKVDDETNLMQQVREFLNSIVAETSESELVGFYYSTDDEISGEPQFTTDIEHEYLTYLDTFGAEATDTHDEFVDRWIYITAEALADGVYPYTGEELRHNIETDISHCYDDDIREFIDKYLDKCHE